MKSIIIGSHQETASVTSFQLMKPYEFIYTAGQFIRLEITVENCDERCNKRNYSLITAPHVDHLAIATRHGVSRFKEWLWDVPQDSEVEITGPFGRMTLNENSSTQAVFLAGGIGITPFHSMITHATYKKLAKHITLLYSNAEGNDIPFKTELDEYARLNPNFSLHHTITADETWAGRKGRIDEAMLKQTVPDWETSEYYIAGPSQMVSTMRELLISVGIPLEKIKQESFTGY